MVKKLKTLKDFEKDKDYDKAERMQNSILITDLRQEAIKISKELNKNPMIIPKNFPKEFLTFPGSNLRIEGAILLLKWFFNITEEDLR